MAIHPQHDATNSIPWMNLKFLRAVHLKDVHTLSDSNSCPYVKFKIGSTEGRTKVCCDVKFHIHMILSLSQPIDVYDTTDSVIHFQIA